MIETDLITYLESALLSDDVDIYWGRSNEEIDYSSDTTVNLIKLPSTSSNFMPTYRDTFQISVRSKYIDKVQEVANHIVVAFQGYSGLLSTYRVWVDQVVNMGIVYEDEYIVHCPIEISVKYTGI